MQNGIPNAGDAEIAGLDIAGLDTNGWCGKGGHAVLNISGRVCESELGNMLRFCYGRPVKTQPTGTKVEKSVELTFTERNYLIAYLK